LMSVVAGDAASFVISHQQFSGDPVSGMLVMIMVGIVLGAPRAFALQQPRPIRAVNRELPTGDGLAVPVGGGS
ncbi:MAG: hypothetical protein ACK5Q5_12430, partial [Planctomycetaceae bacterium]